MKEAAGRTSGEQTNPRKTNPANHRKWQSPCYSRKKNKKLSNLWNSRNENGKVCVIVENFLHLYSIILTHTRSLSLSHTHIHTQTCEHFIVRTHFFWCCLFVCLLINVSREGERSFVRDFSVILDLGDVWHNKNVKFNLIH